MNFVSATYTACDSPLNWTLADAVRWQTRVLLAWTGKVPRAEHYWSVHGDAMPSLQRLFYLVFLIHLATYISLYFLSQLNHFTWSRSHLLIFIHLSFSHPRYPTSYSPITASITQYFIMVQNKGLVFKQVPEGWPKPGQDLVIESRDFDLEQNPPEGGVTVKNYYASFDPYMRGKMRPANVKSYSEPFQLGQPITNRVIAKVLKSNSDKYQKGDLIISSDIGPIEEYSVYDKNIVEKSMKLENPYNLDPKIFLGALGMPGLTAWSSFYEIGQPKKGETIFISAASGAVGQLVGQLAKHEGLKVIGSVGDDKKLEFIKSELGFDSGFNYKKQKPADALAELAPNGIDIYFENVGGEQLEAAITHANRFARISKFSPHNPHFTAHD
jgi:NADPH-dependent curcumin reductase CurA